MQQRLLKLRINNRRLAPTFARKRHQLSPDLCHNTYPLRRPVTG
ncbi:MAG: hypothetical protein VB140_10665 [Burkholderia sp.]